LYFGIQKLVNNKISAIITETVIYQNPNSSCEALGSQKGIVTQGTFYLADAINFKITMPIKL